MKITIDLQNTFTADTADQRGKNTNIRLLALLQKAAEDDKIDPVKAGSYIAKDR